MKSRWAKIAMIAVVMAFCFALFGSVTTASAAGKGTRKTAGRDVAKAVLQSVMDATISVTGQTAQQIKDSLKEGKTLTDIITGLGDSVDNVKAASKTESTSKIQALVTAGTITQKQADRVTGRLDTLIGKILTRHFHQGHKTAATPTAVATATATPGQ